MTRYYYDCPIKAAYMAKYFGMRYLSSFHEYADEGQMSYENGDFYEVLSDGGKRKYHIHPESLPLLEPKLYDDYDMGGGGGIVHIVTAEEYLTVERDLPSMSHQYTTIEMLCGDNISECLSHGWFPIRRNNMAFIWPESEEECTYHTPKYASL